MIKIINDLDTLFVGDLVFDDTITSRIKEEWNEFIKDKDSDSFYDGDIYCVTDIDDKIPLIKISKSKFSCLYYARKTNKITVRSLFSAGFITTSDNYVCIILNNRGNKLNAIGGMADNKDFINNKFDYYKCLVREFMEELGFDLINDSNFDAILRFLKYPSEEESNKAFYPVGTLYEIKTKYTKDQLIDMFNNNEHDNEVKELKFYNNDNYKEVYSYNSKTDYLDEFVINVLGEFNSKKFMNVSDSSLDLDTKEEKEALKKANDDNKEMLSFIKDALDGEVIDVRLTNKLTNHPVCLTTDGEISVEMQKVINAMPTDENVKAKMVLEINEKHKIVDKLKKLYKEDKDELKKYAKILYSSSRLIEGLSVDNPTEISNIICDLLS